MDSDKILTFRMQHPGTCTGMFWRGDPIKKLSPPSNDNWPRNGAVLKGTVHRVGDMDWLKVTECQNSGESSFSKVPEGTWMQFDQGGPVLHPVK